MKYKYFFILTFVVLILSSAVYAQTKPTRFSFEVNGGVPYMFASIPSTISAYGGVGARFNLTTALSAQFSFNMGTMKGFQEQTAPKFITPEVVTNYKSFNSGFYNYALRGQLNLERVFNLRSYKIFRRVNPYLVGGFGFTSTRGDGWVAERYYGASTKTYKKGVSDVWTTQVGALVRVYLSPMFDLNIGSDFNHCQTFYLDGIYADQKYDHYLTNYIGINFKIGASKQKQHIEWQNVIVKEHKPKTRPVEEEKLVEKQPIVVDTKPIAEPAKDTAIAVITSPEVDTAVATKQPLQTETPIVVAPNKEVLVPAVAKTTKTGPQKGIVKATPKSVVRKSDPVIKFNAQSDKNAATLNMIENVSPNAPAKYSVIVGAYSQKQIKYAYMFRDRLRKQGYPAALLQSDINPNIVRVMMYSTDDKNVAIQQCFKARSEIEKGAWINRSK